MRKEGRNAVKYAFFGENFGKYEKGITKRVGWVSFGYNLPRGHDQTYYNRHGKRKSNR